MNVLNNGETAKMSAKKALSKRQMKKIRKSEQEEAAGLAFQEYVETFHETSTKKPSIWVKAGNYNAGTNKTDTTERGNLYNLQPKNLEGQNCSSLERAKECAVLLREEQKSGKGKSNLEMLKEEFRQNQEQRKTLDYDGTSLSSSKIIDNESLFADDPMSTNLYLSNLSPNINEQYLMQLFGKYGSLASVKIMWPKSNEVRFPKSYCGFVAFMNRKDAERALKYLQGKYIMSYEMKIEWSKSVVIPSFPIYIPPLLLDQLRPPPFTGLPFNAQPMTSLSGRNRPKNILLDQSVVKVVRPSEKHCLMLIHRMIEFVIREGPMFEAIIMSRECNNPMFRFLFDNQSLEHIYYRWKLFSMLQGDTQTEWRTKEFRMFKGGSVWKPIDTDLFTRGMPDNLVQEHEINQELLKHSLSNTQRRHLEHMIRHLTMDRLKIAEAMIFCIEHSRAADEIVETIYESLSNSFTLVYKKIARFYLISDILHNCKVRINNAFSYRRHFENRLYEIAKHLNYTYNRIKSHMKAEAFKVRIIRVLQMWSDAIIYPRDVLHKFENIFLGIGVDEDSKKLCTETVSSDSDHDGVALSEDAINALEEQTITINKFDQMSMQDGLQTDNHHQHQSIDVRKDALSSYYVPSKWDKQLSPTSEENTITTTTTITKWDADNNNNNNNNSNNNDEGEEEEEGDDDDDNNQTGAPTPVADASNMNIKWNDWKLRQYSYYPSSTTGSNKLFSYFIPSKWNNTGSSDTADKKSTPGFIPTKWEVVDPDQIEDQAMTTWKWNQLAGASTSHDATGQLMMSSRWETIDSDQEQLGTAIMDKPIVQYQKELEENATKNVKLLLDLQKQDVLGRKPEKKHDKENVAPAKKHESRSPKRRKESSRYRKRQSSSSEEEIYQRKKNWDHLHYRHRRFSPISSCDEEKMTREEEKTDREEMKAYRKDKFPMKRGKKTMSSSEEENDKFIESTRFSNRRKKRPRTSFSETYMFCRSSNSNSNSGNSLKGLPSDTGRYLSVSSSLKNITNNPDSD